MDYNLCKSALVAVAAWAYTIAGIALPVGTACTAMVLADVWTARRLAHRLGRKKPSARQRLKFSSARFSRVIATLTRIYVVLFLAAMLQHVIVGEWFDIVKFSGAVICFWQLVSILENEASCNRHPWARILGLYLADKTRRHLGLDK